MCISSAIQDKIDPASWYMRKQGWAGMVNPAAEVERAIERESGFGLGKTETEKAEDRMLRTPEAQRRMQPRFTGVAAHAVNISRAQSGVIRSTVAPIAQRFKEPRGQ